MQVYLNNKFGLQFYMKKRLSGVRFSHTCSLRQNYVHKILLAITKHVRQRSAKFVVVVPFRHTEMYSNRPGRKKDILLTGHE